jgi:hypothetical protein
MGPINWTNSDAFPAIAFPLPYKQDEPASAPPNPDAAAQYRYRAGPQEAGIGP